MKRSRSASALARAASKRLPRSRLGAFPPPDTERTGAMIASIRPFAVSHSRNSRRVPDVRSTIIMIFSRIGVKRADLRPLVGVEEAREQRAENRRVDQAPVDARGGEHEADFGMLEVEIATTVEQPAVELSNILKVEIAAVLHVGEQLISEP